MRRLFATTALASFLALPAWAGDLVLGAESDLRFDGNVYGTQHNAISDFYWTVAPTAQISEETHSVGAKLNLKPTYELYFDQNRLRGFNYDADGELSWTPSERTKLELSDSFMRYRTLRGFQPGSITPNPNPGGNPSPTPAVQAGREPFLRNVAALSLSHRTSPTGTLELNANYALWNFERANRIDQGSLGASLDYTQLVTPRTRLGAGLSYSRQIFDYVGSPNRHTDYYNGSITFSYVPAETFFVRASVGPTLVRQQALQVAVPANLTRGQLIPRDALGVPLVGIAGTCPLLPSGDAYLAASCLLVPFPAVGFLRLGDPLALIGSAPALTNSGDSWTYFADIAVDKRWDLARVSLAYRRDSGSSSAINFSTIADTVEAQASYQIGRSFVLYFNSAWESRRQTGRSPSAPFVTVLDTLPATPTLPAVTNLVPIGLAANPIRAATERHRIRSVSASVSAQYQLSERIQLDALVGFSDQNATLGSGYEPMQDVFARVGIDFAFKPFRW